MCFTVRNRIQVALQVTANSRWLSDHDFSRAWRGVARRAVGTPGTGIRLPPARLLIESEPKGCAVVPLAEIPLTWKRGSARLGAVQHSGRPATQRYYKTFTFH